jgi:transporter family protein
MFAAIMVLIIVTGRAGNIANIDRKSLFYIVLGGLAGAASWVFYFFALQYGKASQVAPIDRLSVVFVIVLAATILGEKVSLQAAVGTVLVAIGAIIIALAG